MKFPTENQILKQMIKLGFIEDDDPIVDRDDFDNFVTEVNE